MDETYFASSRDLEVATTTTGGVARTLTFKKDEPVAIDDPHLADTLDAVQGVRRVSLEKAAELGHSKAQAAVAKAEEEKAAAEKAAAEKAAAPAAAKTTKGGES